MKPVNVLIVGLGVIGGSLGMALKKRLPGIQVGGMDVSSEIIEEAVKRNVIDWGAVTPDDRVGAAEIIFLAAPVGVMPRIVQDLKPFLRSGTVITDLGSTKENIVGWMEASLPAGVHYLGGHPMAGSEKSGLSGANELLFENAVYVLTPTLHTDPEVVIKIEELVKKLGAKVLLLSPADHDRKVAAVSHLPHIAASALVNTVGALEEERSDYFALAAGGFRDTTRIASGQSGLWSEILLQNGKALQPLIKGLIRSLEEFADALQNRDGQTLMRLLDTAKNWRDQVPTGLKGIMPHLYELTVTVSDRPGAIADFSNLLGNNKVNISDIEIQRVREEDEGTIRLGFDTEHLRDKAAELLTREGFSVRKSTV